MLNRWGRIGKGFAFGIPVAITVMIACAFPLVQILEVGGTVDWLGATLWVSIPTAFFGILFGIIGYHFDW